MGRVVKILRFGLQGIKMCCTFCCGSIVVLCCVVDFDIFVFAIAMYNVIVVIYCILVWLELLAQV